MEAGPEVCSCAAGGASCRWAHPSGSGQWPGQIQDKQPWRSWLSACTCMAVRPRHMHIWPWRPKMGVRKAVCKCTAGGASPESTQSRGQLGVSRLASARHTATEGPRLLLGWEGPGEWGATQVAGVSKHEYLGVTAQWWLCGALVSLVVKAAVLIRRTGHWALCFLPLWIWHWNTGSHLRVTPQLCWSLVGVTEVGPSSSTPEGQGSWSLSPLFLSLWGELFPAGESPLVPRMWPWGPGWWRQKRNVLPSLFVGLGSQVVLVNWVAEVSLIPELSQCCFCLWIALYLIDFCGGMEAGDLLLCHLSEIADNSLLYKQNGRAQGWLYHCSLNCT